MARSKYIYVVTNVGVPLAAFTVKHEAKTWLDQVLLVSPTGWRDYVTVAKMSDNPNWPAMDRVTQTVEAFLES